MKFIHKNPEPQLFASWKAVHPNATYKNDLSNLSDPDAVAAKHALKNSLLAEQKYICCYCECRIADATSHIEHFRPKDQNQFPQLQLDYNNLFASCTKRPTGSSDEHCGHKKGSYFSPDLVSPLEVDCSSHFKYKMDGSIEHCDSRGKTTIEKLHLDSALLDSQRKALIDYFLNLNAADLQNEIVNHLDETGSQLGEFFTTIEYLHNTGQL